MAEHEPIHIIGYGDTGGGKSTFAQTFPKSSKRPMLVLLTDPPDKAGPYYRAGTVQPAEQGEFGPYRSVLNEKGKEIIRVEFFHDLKLLKLKPTAVAYTRFLGRMDTLYNELDRWSTVVLDSTTYLDLAARNYERYVANPNAKEPRQWRAGAADAIERVVMCGLAFVDTNVVVLAHVGTHEQMFHGDRSFSIAAPGRLQKNMPAGYGECYRVYVARDDDDGKVRHRLQTRADETFFAGSQIDAPNPCKPKYDALWTT